MIAAAITQIHTHRRNGHVFRRDGEGGALDTTAPLPELAAREDADKEA